MTPPRRNTPRAQGRPYRRKAARLRREAGVCWLCGTPIDSDLRSPHPLSFSADHVTPLALGGHPLGELRPAHRVCNQKRGTGRRQRKSPDVVDW